MYMLSNQVTHLVCVIKREGGFYSLTFQPFLLTIQKL